MEQKLDIKPTEEQQQAIDEILEWFDNGDSPYKTLAGYAGTGKTTILGIIVNAVEQRSGKSFFSNRKVAVTATTNKAVKVLTQRINSTHFMTIHSLLSIKPKRVGDKEVFEQDKYKGSDMDMSSFDLVVVDECSMISKKLLRIIDNEIVGDTKVLFCGDPAQLEPINEDVSKCFSFSPAMLKTVIRHDDAIASKAKIVRERTTPVSVESLLNEPHIVRREKAQVFPLFENFRKDPDRNRVLCWTNKNVHRWNRTLRKFDWGETPEHEFQEGDIIIANSPCEDSDKKEIIMLNSEEGRILEVDEQDTFYRLTVEIDRVFTGKHRVTVRALKKEFESSVTDQLNLLADEAREDWTKWDDFWRLKKYYHDIRHCYAMTVHKSQGSGFHNVVVDWADIRANRDILNRNQLLYVALTRAENQVIIV